MRRGIRLGEQKEAYDVAAIMIYLRYHALKVVTMQTFLPQLLALALLIIITAVFLPSQTEGELSFGVHRTMTSDSHYSSISSLDDWYPWVDSLYSNYNELQLTKSSSSSSSANASTAATPSRFPVGGLLIRHFALESEACPTSPLSRKLKSLHDKKPSSLGGSFPTQCRGHRQQNLRALKAPLTPLNQSEVVALNPSGGFASTAWGGPDDSRLSFHSRFVGTIEGALGTYTTHNSAVFVPFTNASTATAGSLIAARGPGDTFNPNWLVELREGHWLRASTVAVSVESVTYHLQEDLFLHQLTLLEVRQGGNVRVSTTHFPFRLYTIDTVSDKAFLGMTIALAVIVVFFLLIELIYRLALKRELHGYWASSLEASDWIHLLMILFSIALCASHFYLFYLGNEERPTSSSQSHLVSLSWLLASGETSKWVTTITAWTTFLYMVRVFMFLRYCTRLSLVNETLISSLHDFVGIGFVATLVLVTYALTGHVLWYQTDTDFATYGGAVMMLFNIMISLEVQNYDVYMQSSPRSTFVFFSTFFVVAWCVILNVAVGVLATSFASALETQTFLRRPNWSLFSLARDTKSLFARLFYKGPAAEGGVHSYPGHENKPASEQPADDLTEAALQRGESFVASHSHLETHIVSVRSGLYKCFYPLVPITVRRVVDVIHAMEKYLEVQQKEILETERARLRAEADLARQAEEKKLTRSKAIADLKLKSSKENEPSYVKDEAPSGSYGSTRTANVGVVVDDKDGELQTAEERVRSLKKLEQLQNTVDNGARYDDDEEEDDGFQQASWHKKFDINPKAKEKNMKGVVMLDDFQLWSHLDLQGARRIGDKSSLHIGLHDVKLREWKMLQKAVEGGNDVTTQMATSYRQLQELHECICGSGTDQYGSNNNTSGTEGPVAVLRATLLDVVSHAKDLLKGCPGSRIPELERLQLVLAEYEEAMASMLAEKGGEE